MQTTTKHANKLSKATRKALRNAIAGNYYTSSNPLNVHNSINYKANMLQIDTCTYNFNGVQTNGTHSMYNSAQFINDFVWLNGTYLVNGLLTSAEIAYVKKRAL